MIQRNIKLSYSFPSYVGFRTFEIEYWNRIGECVGVCVASCIEDDIKEERKKCQKLALQQC